MSTKSILTKGFPFIFLMMVLLSGCGRNVPEPLATDTNALTPDHVTNSADLPDEPETTVSEQNTIETIPEEKTANSSSENTSDILPAETTTPSATPSEENEKTVSGKIYEGLYFDESFYQYIDMPQEESPLIYCEITISNTTETTFDFIINEKVMATGETKILVPSGTATICEGTTKAVYQGENLTLTFVFPDDENTFPQHLEVSGLEQLENKVYINNTIPGHESG